MGVIIELNGVLIMRIISKGAAVTPYIPAWR
jgi:hypothetical protein